MFKTGTADNYVDLLDELDDFLTATGSAFGLAYTGTGNGTFTSYKGGSASVAETFTITATSATNFTVVGSVSGSLAAATAGTPYTGTKIQFTITAGGTAFVAGDVFTISTAPKWTSMRRALGCAVDATQPSPGQGQIENILDGKIAEDTSRDWDIDPGTSETITFTFFAPESIAEYAILQGGIGGYPTAWTFEYWSGASWTVIDTRSGQGAWGSNEYRSFAIASPPFASQYRIVITGFSSAFQLRIQAMALRRAVGGHDVAFGQCIWKAPGNDGDSEIFVGVHTFRRVDIDYFNWELAAFDGFTASQRFYDQPGRHSMLYVPLWNDPIPYWFVVNGRRVIVIAKVNTQYEIAYLGFIDPFFSPNQMPYPMALGGTLALGDILAGGGTLWDNTAWRWSNSTDKHRLPTHSDTPNGALPQDARVNQMRARAIDGQYWGFRSSRADGYTGITAGEHVIRPYVEDFNQLDVNLDGSYSLWPVELCHAAPNIFGILDGIRAIAGQGVTSETLVRKGVVDWIVVPNITRTDRNDFCVVALD